jgi:hypothetical protein
MDPMAKRVAARRVTANINAALMPTQQYLEILLEAQKLREKADTLLKGAGRVRAYMVRGINDLGHPEASKVLNYFFRSQDPIRTVQRLVEILKGLKADAKSRDMWDQHNKQVDQRRNSPAGWR